MQGRRDKEVLARYIYACLSSADRDGECANTAKHLRRQGHPHFCSAAPLPPLCTATVPSNSLSWPFYPKFSLLVVVLGNARAKREPTLTGCEIIPARTLASSFQRPAVDDRAQLPRYLSAAEITPFRWFQLSRMLGCGQGRNVLETRSSSPSQGPRRCSVSIAAITQNTPLLLSY